MTRRTLAVLILTTWVGSLGWLAQRQLAAHRAAAAAAAAAGASARQPSQALQQQYQQALESALQSPTRELPVDAR